MLLHQQHCKANYSPTILTNEKIDLYLKEIPKWQATSNYKIISRSFDFKDYHQTLSFINGIASIIHNENHHPNISFGYNNCTINYSTHSANGITLFDLICAAKIEQHFQE